jgi:hypothetical protein
LAEHEQMGRAFMNNYLLTTVFAWRYARAQLQVLNLAHHVKHRNVGPDDWARGCICSQCAGRVNRAWHKEFGGKQI